MATLHARREAGVTGGHSHACVARLILVAACLGPAVPQALTLVLPTRGHSLSALSPAHCPPRETHSPSPTLHCSSAPSSSAPLCCISSSGQEEEEEEEGGGRKLSVEPLLTRPAWPAARLSQTRGATGPARKVLRCLWAPLLRMWPVHVRPLRPPAALAVAAPVTCPFPLACGGQRQPPLPLSWVCLESIWGRALTAWLLRGSGAPTFLPG